MDSDHRLLMTDLVVKAEKMQNKEKRNGIKVESLKECDNIREYIRKINEDLEQLERVGKMEEIQETIRRIAEETLGKRWVGGTKKRHTKWWTEEVKEAIKRKTVLMRRWLKNRTVQTRAQYVEARNCLLYTSPSPRDS